MSQRIADLEMAVGVPLVRRTTRSMRLTDAGERLVGEIGQSYEAIAQSFVRVADASDEPRGLIRLTAPVALARQQLVPMFAAFLLEHPAIRIELNLSDKIASLGTEGFDLAIRHATSPPDTHVAWQLCKTESMLVASPAYLMSRPSPIRPEQLQQHACLHYPRGRDDVVWSMERGSEATRAYRRVSVAVSGPLAANNSEALRDAAVAGLGIALIPDFSAQVLLRSGVLIRVLPDWRASGTFADKIYALRPFAAQVPRAVELLVKFLRSRFAEGFLGDSPEL